MPDSGHNGVIRKVDAYSGSLLAYAGVSVVSALTEWLTFALALSLLAPLTAAAAGFVVATAVNFLLSRYLAFRSVRSPLQDLILVFAMSGVAFAANIGIFYLLYAHLGLGVLYAKVLGTCAGFIFNYAFRQFLIFSRVPRIAPVAAILRGSSDGRAPASAVREKS